MKPEIKVLTFLLLCSGIWDTARSAANPAGVQPVAVAPTLAEIRREARSLVKVQSILSWYTRTRGEPSIQAETYIGHEALFANGSIRAVGAALASEKDPDQKRALTFLKSYLAAEHLGQKLAQFSDQVDNAELSATVKLPFLNKGKPVPYKELENTIREEKDAGRRAAIEAARAGVWKQTLNPILEKKEAEAQRLAKALGYRSYVDLAQEARMVDLRPLIADGARFFQATDERYKALLAELAKKELGLSDPQKLRRADLSRMRKAPRFDRFFPRELAVPALRHFLAGIGLSLTTAAGTQILIDDEPHPQKEQRAACFAIQTPGDIRVSMKPTGGLDDFMVLFHEGGHALHYAHTVTGIWEFQQLGPYTLTEGLAEAFGHAWDDPAWLVRYRDFVKEYNQKNGKNVPLLSDADIAEIVHVRIYDELYFLRRYASAKLIYESALHGGDPALWKEVYQGQTQDLQVLYRDLFSRAYGFPLSAEDALRFRTDVDDLFYSADYTRAFALSNLIHEGLSKRFGADFYANKAVGAFLKEQLFKDGNKLQPDEVARLFGFDKLDLRPTEQRMARLWRP